MRSREETMTDTDRGEKGGKMTKIDKDLKHLRTREETVTYIYRGEDEKDDKDRQKGIGSNVNKRNDNVIHRSRKEK